MKSSITVVCLALASLAMMARTPASIAAGRTDEGVQHTAASGPIAGGDADKTPWGATVDGLACRLLVCPEYCVGQPVSALVEIKNVSDRKRHMVHLFNILDKERAEMKVIGPDGKPLQQRMLTRGSPSAASVKPIEPGKTIRVEMSDLGSGVFLTYDAKMRTSGSQFATPGEYRLTYTLHAPTVPKQMVVGEEIKNGERRKIYHEFPDDVMNNFWSGTLASNAVAVKVVPIGKDDLRVHEWGVFTVFGDVKYANTNRKAEWAALPDFFYRQFPTQRLRWVPAMWDKPVIYFHSKRPSMTVNVQVAFPDGAPVAWWPACSEPLDDGMTKPKPPPVFNSLFWKSVRLGRVIPEDAYSYGNSPVWHEVKEAALPEDCWLAKARLNEAMPVTVYGSSNMKRGRGGDSLETERFIFYDGLVPAPDYLRCAAAGADSLTLRNTAAFAIEGLFVVDRRTAVEKKGVRFALVEKIEPGKEMRVSLREVSAEQWPGDAQREIQKALVAAGLFDSEAASLLDIWQKGFFEAPGLTALYILPRAEYDRMIRLDVEPKPAEVVRVAVAAHRHLELEPTGLKRAKQLLAQLDSVEWRDREDATKELLDIGPPAIRLIADALKTTASAEVQKRCQELLDQVDASQYLKK